MARADCLFKLYPSYFTFIINLYVQVTDIAILQAALPFVVVRSFWTQIHAALHVLQGSLVPLASMLVRLRLERGGSHRQWASTQILLLLERPWRRRRRRRHPHPPDLLKVPRARAPPEFCPLHARRSDFHMHHRRRRDDAEPRRSIGPHERRRRPSTDGSSLLLLLLLDRWRLWG